MALAVTQSDNKRSKHSRGHGRRNNKTRQGRNRANNNNNAPVTTAKSRMCSVCDSSEGRYKCPKCRAPYCSVQCCQRHKLDSSCALSTAAASASPPSKYMNANAAPRINDDNDNDGQWKITDEMKDKLHNSTWLRDELTDSGLRQLITFIVDRTDDDNEQQQQQHHKPNRKFTTNHATTAREEALIQAKLTNIQFSKFIDKLLLTAGVLTTTTTTIINNHETNSFDDRADCCQLVLIPLPPKSKRTIDSVAEKENLDLVDNMDDEQHEKSVTNGSNDRIDDTTTSSDDDDSSECSSNDEHIDDV